MKRKETEGFNLVIGPGRGRKREKGKPLVNDFRKRVTFVYPVDESRELISMQIAGCESIRAGKMRAIRSDNRALRAVLRNA